MHNFARDRKQFFLAVNTGYVVQGEPDDRCLNFYHARSGNGLHCAIVGNVVIPQGVASNDVCAQISKSQRWQDLAQAISDKGAIAGIQLSSTWLGYKGITQFVPRLGEEPIAEYRRVGLSISKQQATAYFDGLQRGTDLALNAGFRHVQLHAAHGYLFNILVDSRFSPHADLAFRSINRWAENLAAENIETSLRFSMLTGDEEQDLNRSTQFADDVSNLPVNFIDASSGFYNINKRLIYPSTQRQLEERMTATLEIANRHPSKNFILSGKSMGFFDSNISSNLHIGICRDLIANPNFLLDRKNGCKTCMECHYFSRGEKDLTCGQWPKFSETV